MSDNNNTVWRNIFKTCVRYFIVLRCLMLFTFIDDVMRNEKLNNCGWIIKGSGQEPANSYTDLREMILGSEVEIEKN